MSLFTRTLETSRLLAPWMGVATLRSASIHDWLQESRLGRLFVRPAADDGPANAKTALGILLQNILPAGIIVLFIAQAFMGTGVIGGLVVMLFGIGLSGWLLNRLPKASGQITAVDLMVALFLSSSVISTAFSSYIHTSWVGLVKMLVFMSGYVVFRWVGVNGNRTVTVIRLLWVLVGLGLLESAIGFYQHAMHVQPLATWSDPSINSELKMDRIFGTLKPSNPNLLAGFLIPCLAASAGLSLVYMKKKTWLLSAGLLGASLAILYALVLTGSRGGFLAIAIMALSMFAYGGHLIWREEALEPYRQWLKPLWLTILVISILGATGGVLSSEKLRARVLSMFAMREDSSISYRLNVYNSAMQMAKDNPIVGIGPGNGTFKLVYGLYMVPGFTALGAYSVPLEIAVEQGLLGLLIFLSLMIVLKLRAFLALDNPAVSLQRKLVIGALLTGILGSFAYGFFDTIWYRPSVNLLFWFMVASLAALSEPPVDVNIFKGRL